MHTAQSAHQSQLLTQSMTDNVSSEKSGERTEGPPPTKKLKEKKHCNLAVPRIQLPPIPDLHRIAGYFRGCRFSWNV